MQIKELSVEVKKSHNYQTFTAGEVVYLEEGDDANEVRAAAMARCRQQVMAQIELEAKASAAMPTPTHLPLGQPRQMQQPRIQTARQGGQSAPQTGGMMF
jgi:hypothetical protein